MMAKDVCIKAGTFCPVCCGSPLSDCWHSASEFQPCRCSTTVIENAAYERAAIEAEKCARHIGYNVLADHVAKAIRALKK